MLIRFKPLTRTISQHQVQNQLSIWADLVFLANLGLEIVDCVAAFDIHCPDVEVQCVNNGQRELRLLWVWRSAFPTW